MSAQGLKLMLERAKALLAADPGIDTWAQTHFGSALTVFVGNLPIDQIHNHELPAAFIVTGEAENQIEVGNQIQRPQPTMPIGFVWHEDDREKAVWQSAELADLVIQFAMRHPELADLDQGQGEACVGAHVARYQTDRGGPTSHPRHQLNVDISAEYEVYHA